MTMSAISKLGVSAGVGSAAALLTDAALQYWAERSPKKADGTPEVDKDGKPVLNWYYEYSSLVGGAASLAAAGILYKTMGKEEALVCAIAGIGTALAIPTRTYVAEARSESETANPSTPGLYRLNAMRALAGRPVAVAAA